MEVKQTAREFLTEKFVPEVQRSGRHASVEVDLVQVRVLLLSQPTLFIILYPQAS